MKSVLKILDQNSFSFSVEIIPPRNGVDFQNIFQQIKNFSKANFQFISVTHGAGGSLRGGTIPICHFAQNQANLTSIAHLTCRGVSKEDIENSLIDHHYFDINNILALRGDPPDGIGKKFKVTEGGFSYAYQLIELIHNMNQGRYLIRKNFDASKKYREGISTNFCIGAACYPEDQDGKDIEYLKIKKEKGADFAITQIVYDIKILEHFFKKVNRLWGNDFPIIAGIRIPDSYEQLIRMKQKFSVNIPQDLISSMQKTSENSEAEMRKAGLNWTLGFVEKILKIGFKGIHVFVMNRPQLAIDLMNQFR